MNGTKRFTIASSQEIALSWQATAEDYGNLVEAYRYGFNLIDPDDEDDPGGNGRYVIFALVGLGALVALLAWVAVGTTPAV